MLEVQDLQKQLGDLLVLNSVSFNVREGEFFVLLGPSGSGKSTLLRIICGLESPDKGRVLIDGREITDLPPRNRNLAMVFQDYGLYPNMNVYQNIAYGLEARRVPSNQIQARVPEAAAKLGLGELLDRSIVDLSGGEQQRVALARAMVKDADAYLYDEPLSNLDPKLRFQARQDILKVHWEKQRPSLYVTHDQTEAFAIADRIALLHAGHLQQVGTAEALLHCPANLFVAQFVGEPRMNLVRGSLAGHDGTNRFVSDGFAIDLPAAWKPALDGYAKEQVILGFRPETLAQEGESDEFEIGPGNGFTAEVVDVEALIGETIVTLRVGKATTLLAMFGENLFDLDGGAEIGVGQTLRVGVDPERITLFDPENERTLKEAVG